MKKLFIMLMTLSMFTCLFTGCNKGNVEIDPEAEANVETVEQVQVDVGGEDWGEEDYEADYAEKTAVDISGADDAELNEVFKPVIHEDGTLDEQSAAQVRRQIIQSIVGKDTYHIDSDIECEVWYEHGEDQDITYDVKNCSQKISSDYDGKKAHVNLALQYDSMNSNIEAYYEFGPNFLAYKNADTIQVWSKMTSSEKDVEANWYTIKQADSVVNYVTFPFNAEVINKMENSITSIPDEEHSAYLTEFFKTLASRESGESIKEDIDIKKYSLDVDGNIVDADGNVMTPNEDGNIVDVEGNIIKLEDGNIIVVDTDENVIETIPIETTEEDTTEIIESAEEINDDTTLESDLDNTNGDTAEEINDADSIETTSETSADSIETTSETSDASTDIGEDEIVEENPLDGIYQVSGDISAKYIGNAEFKGLGLDFAGSEQLERYSMHVTFLFNAITNEIVSAEFDMSKLSPNCFGSIVIDRLPDTGTELKNVNVGIHNCILRMGFSKYNEVEEIEIPEEIQEEAINPEDLHYASSDIYIYF